MSFEVLKSQLAALGIPASDSDVIFANSSLGYGDYLLILKWVQKVSKCRLDCFFLLLCLFENLYGGSICMDLEPWVSPAFLDGIHEFKPSVLFFVDGGAFSSLIGFPGDDRVLIREKNTIFFQKYFQVRERVVKKLSVLLQNRVENEPDLDSWIEEIYEPSCSLRNQDRLLVRDENQILAIKTAFYHHFCMISGGPGTGKTSIVTNIARIFCKKGIDAQKIIFAAPTGKAASRLSQSLQENILSIQKRTPMEDELLFLEGKTLHRVLGVTKNGFLHNKHHCLDCDLLIVDEVSMVDALMMDALLSAVDEERTRVIFLGDHQQLPSVEAGAIFAELIQKNRHQSFVFELQTVYRSKKNLQFLASCINKGRVLEMKTLTDLPKILGDDEYARILPLDLSLVLSNFVKRFFTGIVSGEKAFEEENLRRLFCSLREYQILCVTRTGPLGIESLNSFFLRVLGARKQIFASQRIIICENSYELGIYNGDTGIILEKEGCFFAVFESSSGYLTIPVSALPAYEPAYAMTVHKSQGSEFEHVLLILPALSAATHLSRELLYTAVTRAKKTLWIYGDDKVLERGCTNTVIRRSGMNLVGV